MPGPATKTYRFISKWCKQLIAILLTLFALGWWCLSQPEQMRLGKCISVNPADLVIDELSASGSSPLFFGSPVGLYLHIDRMANAPKAPARLSLIGWDGKPRWQIENFSVNPVLNGIIIDDLFRQNPTIQVAALSPNGRVFTLLRSTKHGYSITSWSDGQLRGTAHLQGNLSRYTNGAGALQVMNSGRVWLYAGLDIIRCSVWAIDGSQVAHGTYQPSFILTKTSSGTCTISPDGAHLICANTSTLDYADLQVVGKTIHITRCYSAKSEYANSCQWLDGQYAIGYRANILGPAGVISSPREAWEKSFSTDSTGLLVDYASAPLHRKQHGAYQLRVFLPPPGTSWEVPTNRCIASWLSSADQRTCLLVESTLDPDGMNAGLTKLIASYAFLSWLQPRPRLALYTAPGRLRTVLPVPDPASVKALGLSPDGRQLAIYTIDSTGKGEICLYTWGKTNH
ncbi:MAG TPA: hypothetical protein VGM23_01100 [Armatimonadota bacterium]